jgi:hypothetical protein
MSPRDLFIVDGERTLLHSFPSESSLDALEGESKIQSNLDNDCGGTDVPIRRGNDDDDDVRCLENDVSSDTTSSTSDTSSTTDEVRTTKISFGAIHVREYEVIVGDNPDVRVGPPISLGWRFIQHDDETIDDYEKRKAERPRRPNLRLSSITRKNLLSNVFGVPEEEIRSAEKENQKIQRQRQATVRQVKTVAKVETVMQSARRRIRNAFSSDNMSRSLAAMSSHAVPGHIM